MTLNYGGINEVYGYSPHRPPFFEGTNYQMWKKRITIYIKSQDIEVWKVIAIGPHVSRTSNGEIKRESDYNENDWHGEQLNSKAMKILYCALNPEDSNQIASCESAKEMWKML